MNKKSKYSLDIYSLIPMLVAVSVAGYLLFREGYCAIAPWFFWLLLISFLGLLFILVTGIVCWLMSFSRAEHRCQVLFGFNYALLIVLVTGMAIASVMINQRYDMVVFAAVVITVTALSTISIFKSGVLDKKEEEIKEEVVIQQSE